MLGEIYKHFERETKTEEWIRLLKKAIEISAVGQIES